MWARRSTDVLSDSWAMEKRGLLSSRGMGDSGASIRAAFAAAAGLSFAALLLVACVYTPERLERGFGEGHATALFGEGGLGTFPGGQSTGGYSEFDFEHLPARSDWDDTIASELKRLKPKVWTVVAGPCKGMGSVDELKACVRGKLDVSASGDAGRAAVQEAKRIHFALTRPGSAGVGKQSSNPSLEDIIGANQMPDMSGTNKRLDDLQRQMDGIVNHRLLDTEDLTKETSDMWRARTSNLCCQDMFDTVCNQPCHF